MSHKRAIVKSNQRMNETFRVDDCLYTAGLYVEKLMCFNKLHGFIKQSGTINRDPLAHVPVWMR